HEIRADRDRRIAPQCIQLFAERLRIGGRTVIMNRDVRPLGVKPAHERSADASRGAGDENSVVVKRCSAHSNFVAKDIEGCGLQTTGYSQNASSGQPHRHSSHSSSVKAALASPSNPFVTLPPHV